MTMLYVLSCNGELPSEMRCRAKLSLEFSDPRARRIAAARAGWRRIWNDDPLKPDSSAPPLDFCPSCSRRLGMR